jgi:ABC-type multidrug transport system fused ATPase/permease subunit
MFPSFRSLNSAVNGSVLLFTMSPSLCLVSLSVCPIVGIGSMFLSKYSRKVANRLRELEGKVTSYILERLVGMTTVRVNNRETTERLAYEKHTEDCCTLSASTHFAQGSYAV